MGRITTVDFNGDWTTVLSLPDRAPKSEHHRLYIADFEDGSLKIGITRDLKARIVSLSSTRRGLGLPSTPRCVAFSAPHRAARASERALLEDNGFQRLAGEYVAATFAAACTAAEWLQSLPVQGEQDGAPSAPRAPVRASPDSPRDIADLERRAEASEQRAREAEARARAAEAREQATLARLGHLEARLDRLGEMVALLSGRAEPARPAQALTEPTGEAADVLHGYSEIGTYMRISKDQAKHRAVAGKLPTFKLGRKVCARRSTLINWMQNQEAIRHG